MIATSLEHRNTRIQNSQVVTIGTKTRIPWPKFAIPCEVKPATDFAEKGVFDISGVLRI